MAEIQLADDGEKSRASLLPPDISRKWCNRVRHRSARASWRYFARRHWRTLLKGSDKRRIIHADAHRHEAVLFAHGFHQPLLTGTQDFEGQGLKVAEYPEKIKFLSQRGLQVSWPEWGQDPEHARSEFFKPH